MIATLLLLTPQARPNDALDRAIHWVRSANRAAFTISFRSKAAVSGRYEVAYIRPDRMRIRGVLPTSDRTFTLVGRKVYGVDHRAGEYLTTTGGKMGSVADRLNTVIPVDEPVRIIADAKAGAKFLEAFKVIKNWRYQRTSSGVSLDSKEAGGSYAFRFDVQGRLTLLKIESPSGWFEWTYRYGPAPSSITFNKPRGTKLVRDFFETLDNPKGNPTYRDAATKKVMESALRAYERLRAVACDISGTGDTVSIWVNDRSYRQRTPVGEWAWSGKRLEVIDSRKKVFRTGKLGWREADVAVAKLGLAVDPLLQKLARRENALAALLSSDMKGRTIGSMKAEGVDCDVVELTAPRYRLTLTIRQSDHLMLASSSEALNASGKVMSRSERRFRYSQVNQPLAPSTFRLTPPPDFRRTGL